MISRWAKWVLLFIYLTVSDGRIATYIDPFWCSYNYWKKYRAFWFFFLSFIYFYKVGCKYIESVRLTLAFTFLGGVLVHTFNLQHYSALLHLDSLLLLLVPVPVGHVWCLGNSCWLIWSSCVLWDILLCLRACHRAGSRGVWASNSARWLILPKEPTRPTPCITLKNKYKHTERGKGSCRHASSYMHAAQHPALHAQRAQQAGEVLNHSPSHRLSCWGPPQRKVCAWTCICFHRWQVRVQNWVTW